MRQMLSIFLMLILLFTFLIPVTAYADSVGDGNVDGGGGGMGNGSSTDYWNGGDEGVRVTVIRVSDHALISNSYMCKLCQVSREVSLIHPICVKSSESKTISLFINKA